MVRENPGVTRRLRRRIREEGPLRSADMEGRGSRGWWDLKVAKRVATALWSSGELAIRERRSFQRAYDLAERVIPADVHGRSLSKKEGLETLLLRALSGHGWATPGTLSADLEAAQTGARSSRVASSGWKSGGEVLPCALENPDGRPTKGWIRPADLELAGRLASLRPRRETGVLLSPFDPCLWDRPRVRRLFDFDQLLEIFKPAPKRLYGYYCLPVLAGERLVARFDLKGRPQARHPARPLVPLRGNGNSAGLLDHRQGGGAVSARAVRGRVGAQARRLALDADARAPAALHQELPGVVGARRRGGKNTLRFFTISTIQTSAVSQMRRSPFHS